MNRFIAFIDGPIAGTELVASYNHGLVLLSYLVACFAAYTALDFAGRVTESRSSALISRAWLLGGAGAMGAGIWGMHFIAMLAFRIPIPVHYDLGITLLSLAVAIAFSGFAMALVTRGSLPIRRLLAGGCVMGLGVVTMHYTGMAAVRMDAQMLYRPGLFALSVANAIVCSTVALWLVFRLGTQSRHGGAARYRLASAFFMGIAICGMHYTAIHAGVCVSPRAVADAIVPLDPDLQTMVIGGVALLFTSVVLGVSMQNQIVSAKLRAQNEQLRDQIEERRRVEAALLEAKQLAEAANQAKSEFLSNMSHELRTPMHAILSFSKIGMERAGEAQREKLLRYFTNIDRSATRLMVLLNDVLDLSKIEAGKMKFEFCRADMGAAIRAVVEEFEETARACGVGIDTRIEASQPHAEIDSTRMQQVVRNLVSNAVKFSPDGGHVQVRLADCASPDGDSAPWLLLTVTDQGPGIPADELQLVFEKFVQSSKTKTGAGGTGLGLAIVREIMQAHGGGVQARNRPGGGAEFLAAFPARGACDGRPNAMVAADCARPAARPAVAAPDSAGQNEAGADLRISPAAPSR